jgi:hypothetical protein
MAGINALCALGLTAARSRVAGFVREVSQEP